MMLVLLRRNCREVLNFKRSGHCQGLPRLLLRPSSPSYVQGKERARCGGSRLGEYGWASHRLARTPIAIWFGRVCTWGEWFSRRN